MITADEIYRCLQAIEKHLALEEYEKLGVWTEGGINGTYALKTPVQTEAEWAFYGITATSACQIQISNNSGSNNPAVNGTVGYGLSSSGSEGNPLEAQFFAVSAATPFVPSGELFWQPIKAGGTLWITIAGLAGSQSAFVMIAWRRLLLRSLALVETREVSRHVLPQHTNPQRVLPAESVQAAGFGEGRYPLPGGRPYRHKVSPGNPIDPGWTNAGGEIARPLTPLEILRAKTRQAKGGVG